VNHDQKKTKIVLSIGVVVAAVLCIPLAALVLDMVPPKVSVTCTTDSDGRLDIHVRRNFRISGLGFVVRLEGQEDPLWAVDLSKKKAWSIPYGQRPMGVRQTYPPMPEQPKEIPPGAVFHIDVDYTFDHWMMPSGGRQSHTFRMSEAGVPEPVD